MWGGSYADCHRGFCAEYTVLPNDPHYQEIFCNLFPMTYCKVRPNMTERLAGFENKEPTREMLWDIYFHGALRKSIDWAFQNEWRLLLPMERNRTTKDYCVPFFLITKVFLGNRMPQAARKEIIEICHERNIPYIGVTRNPDIFEMQECAVKCEYFPNYTGSISKQLNIVLKQETFVVSCFSFTQKPKGVDEHCRTLTLISTSSSEAKDSPLLPERPIKVAKACFPSMIRKEKAM